MTQITFVQRAPDRSVFSPGCFDHQVGEIIPFNLGIETITAVLVSAEVLPSGEGVKLTLDVPDREIFTSLPGSFSIAEDS
jgi:hypothetical protein